MLLSELASDVFYSFLKVSSEVTLANHQRLFLKEVGESRALRVNVLDSFINTILSDEFSRELEAIRSLSLKRDSVMHVVNVFLSPLTEVTNKSVEVVTLRHINGTVAVVMTHFIHEHESHVFVIDVKNEVRSLLEDFLRGFLLD